jgi:hypothetical protein
MDKRNSKASLLKEIGRLKKALNSAKNNHSAKKIQRVFEAGEWGIAHVGLANYAERESEANEKLNCAMYGPE